MTIRTPDQRLRVFVSSTLLELAEERAATREAINHLRLTPVMFETGARPHPPQSLYRAYLEQSHVFIGLYWERYGWVAPDMTISGLEDEYVLSGNKPKLIYIKSPAPNREPRLQQLLDRIRSDASASYKPFATPAELQQLVENDLAILLTERFETVRAAPVATSEQANYNNLPAASTPLIGRDGDIGRVAELILRGDVRLVTLYGPGGIGKTRLAAEVGRRVLPQFTHGVCFVPLSNVSDPDLVIPAIGASLGLGETRASGLKERVVDALRDKHLLLILDNFEQVLPAATAIAELLQLAPRVEVLVTSRTVLRVRGEHESLVQPLDLPEQREALAYEQIRSSSAVQLFVERAKAVQEDFALTPANAQAVAGIAAQLDGLPLAIELAAARVKILTPRALLSKLSDVQQQAKLLSGGARDLPERQQTLLNTLAWSYGLLTPEEQRWFERLSIFADGWTLESVTPVCEFEDELAAVDAMASLADKSLIQRVATRGEAERFAMLRMLRDFAATKLAARGEGDQVAARHAAYFATVVVRAESQVVGAEQKQWLATLNEENGNIQAALSWLIDSGDVATAAQMGWSLRTYWLITARLSEGLHWMTRALPWLAAAPGPDGTVDRAKLLDRAKALGVAGFSAAWRGSADWARTLIAQAEAIGLQASDAELMGMVHTGYAVAAISTGAYEEAHAHFVRSLECYREAGDQWSAVMVLSGLLRTAGQRRDFETGERVYRDLQSLLPSLKDGVSAGVALCEIGFVALQRGNLSDADTTLRRAIRLSHECDHREGVIWSLENMAALAHTAGDVARAGTLLGAAHAIRDLAGIPVWHAAEGSQLNRLRMAVRAKDPQAFDIAWARGAAMTIDQAVHYAAGAAIGTNAS